MVVSADLDKFSMIGQETASYCGACRVTVDHVDLHTAQPLNSQTVVNSLVYLFSPHLK